MADQIRYVLDVDDKGTPKLVKFGDTSERAGKQAKKSFDFAGDAIGKVGEQIPGVGGAMQAMAGGPMAAAAAGAAVLVAGFGAMVSKSIDMADGMNDLSLRLGISTERLSVLSLYAEQSGTDIDTLASAMGKLGVKVASGDKDLRSYGVTAGSADEALFQLADKIAGTTDPMMRLKIATDAFGKSGQQMLPLLVQGGDALREMGANAPIVSTEMAHMADEFNDKMAEMKGQFVGIGLGIAQNVLPFLQDWLSGVDRIRIAFGMLNTQEERAAGRQKIIDQYNELIEKRKEGEKLLGKLSGPVRVDGKTLQQSLAAYDAETDSLAPKPTNPDAGYKDPAEEERKKKAAADAAKKASDEAMHYREIEIKQQEDAFNTRQKLAAEIKKENADTSASEQKVIDEARERAQKEADDIAKREDERLQYNRDLNRKQADEKLKALKDERDAYQSHMAEMLGMHNSTITSMLKGEMSLSNAKRQIWDTTTSAGINALLKYGEAWIAQQITQEVFGDAIKAAELAKAEALGATLASAYTPAAYAASVMSFGGAAAAGSAAYLSGLAASQTAGLVMRETGGTTLVGGNRMIVGDRNGKGGEEFRPTVPGNIINNHQTTSNRSGDVYHITVYGGDLRTIERQVRQRQRGSR